MNTIEERFNNYVKNVGKVMTPNEETVINSISIIRNKLKTYIQNAGLKGLVIGISGGLDSACVAAIAAPVCNELNIKLMGMSIPLSSSITHKEQAKWVGEAYCDAFMEMDAWETDYDVVGSAHSLVEFAVSTTDRVAAMAGFDTYEFERNIQQANIKSRLRMISLYDLAHKTKSMVLGTGNFSEDCILFFFTTGGDGQVDWSPIKGVSKGFELPVFAKVLGIRDDIITQSPSDGLAASEADTDMAQVGVDSYMEVDAIGFGMLGLLNNELTEVYNTLTDYYKVKLIIDRHNRYKFKEYGEVFVGRGENNLPAKF